MRAFLYMKLKISILACVVNLIEKWFVFLFSLSLLFTGCSYSYIEKGTFEAFVPETFTGLAYPIGDDTTNVWKVNISIRNYSNRHLQLHGIENSYEKTQNRSLYTDCEECPKDKNIKADLRYNFRTFPVTGSMDYFLNAKRILVGFGVAFDPYPRLRSSVGFNSKYFEFGGFVSFGFANVSYSVNQIDYMELGNMAGGNSTWIDSVYCKDCSEWKMNGNFGAYINIFPTKKLSLSYAPSAFSPWLYDDIKCYENGTSDCSLAFDFPYIFAQYFGVSYLFTMRIQSSLGVKVYFGDAFSERIWNIESKTSFLF